MPVKNYKRRYALAKQVARSWSRNNFTNKTEALLEIQPEMKRTSASVKASRLLNSSTGEQALKEILDEDENLNNRQIAQILTRNARQKKQLSASNTALDIAIRVKDEYPKHEETQKHLHLHLSAEEIDQKLTEIDKELAEIG